MKKKPDIIYIIVNVLCLVLLIADIEFKNYFNLMNQSFEYYRYPLVMTNLAGPLIVCLLIAFRQSHHQKASLSNKIIVDSCSAIVFLVFNFFIFRFSLIDAIPPESLVFLCLLIVPAVYNIYKKIQARLSAKSMT